MSVPVQYHVIVNIDIFKRIVDDVGGITLDVPYPMFHRDDAAGLLIDLKSGVQHLDGIQASNFVRYRGALGDDYRRIDNVETLLAAFIDRVQQLNLRALGAVPRLIDTYTDEVETNVPPRLLVQLTQHLNTASLRALTLPTHEREGTTALRYDPVEVERFLASAFGGKARKVVKTPDVKLLITNRSGSSGLALKVQRYLIALGIPKQNVVTRNATFDPVPTRLLVTAPSVADALFYADLFSVDWQQVYQLEPVAGANVGMELVLGKDAAKWADKL
jgi:anionic cell wall polymer biosynthesis LytR-Cps2A-Psr (LCP) family protein